MLQPYAHTLINLYLSAYKLTLDVNICKLLTILHHVNRINILNIKIFSHYTIRRNYKNMYVGDELMAYTSSED